MDALMTPDALMTAFRQLMDATMMMGYKYVYRYVISCDFRYTNRTTLLPPLPKANALN
jgi:hypothetical protein